MRLQSTKGEISKSFMTTKFFEEEFEYSSNTQIDTHTSHILRDALEPQSP